MQYFIYQLRCPITKEIKYVGQTTKTRQRFDQHKWGTKEDSREKREWITELKNKKLAPLFEVIDLANNKKDALILEKQYIVTYLDMGEMLFNIYSKRALKQYDSKGVLVATFNTVREVKEKIGLRVRTTRGLSAGYLFTYGEFDKKVFDKIIEGRSVKCKAVIQKTKDGVFVNEFKGVREAGRQTGIDHRSIAEVANKSNPKRHSAGGYKWEYKI